MPEFNYFSPEYISACIVLGVPVLVLFWIVRLSGKNLKGG